MSAHGSAGSNGTLPPGLIFEIARDAEIEVPETGEKRPIHCPLHEDKNASAFLSTRNVFFCSCCTPDGGWPAKRFAHELGLDWERYVGKPDERPRPPPARPRPPPPQTAPEARATAFSAHDAQDAWGLAFARARDDEAVEADREVYEYIYRRGLGESWELGAFGILPPSRNLHPAIVSWPARGYRIVAPLYNQRGEVASLQARGLGSLTPKTLTPKGSSISGTVFADSRGRALLRGECAEGGSVIFGEGLTDSLALTIASPMPVLTAPGTGVAVAAIGPWARGRSVLLALDIDDAGNGAVKPVSRALFDQGAIGVRRIRWHKPAKDACDALEGMGAAGLRNFLCNPPRLDRAT